MAESDNGDLIVKYQLERLFDVSQDGKDFRNRKKKIS